MGSGVMAEEYFSRWEDAKWDGDDFIIEYPNGKTITFCKSGRVFVENSDGFRFHFSNIQQFRASERRQELDYKTYVEPLL